jgi:hypothetical protein
MHVDAVVVLGLCSAAIAGSIHSNTEVKLGRYGVRGGVGVGGRRLRAFSSIEDRKLKR